MKKIIALLLAVGISCTALAQDNVSIYGRLDYGYVSTNGNNGGVNNAQARGAFESGVSGASRIGFYGQEKLNNDAKVIFKYEFGTGIDTTAAAGSTAATWTNRASWVGVESNTYGALIGGRMNTDRYDTVIKYDAFDGGTVGVAANMASIIARQSNSIRYTSPVIFDGFRVGGSYSNQVDGNENTGNNNDVTLGSVNGSYEKGPFSITALYGMTQSVNKTIPTPTTDGTMVTVGASYDFGVVKVLGFYDQQKQDLGRTTVVNYSDWTIGAIAPIPGISGLLAKASYSDLSDKISNNDASKYAFGVDYNLSKRTKLYADYAHISNQNNAAYRISVAPGANGSSANGIGVTGFDVGISHKF